jgi:hypothetical protein
MTSTRKFLLTATVVLLAAVLDLGPLQGQSSGPPATPKVYYACYGSLAGVVYRIKEPGIPSKCLHSSHVEFSWTDGTGAGGVTDHGALSGLGDDDHPQYLKTDGSRALTGALSAGGNKVINLAAASDAGDAVRYDQVLKADQAAGGDLSGNYPDPAVAKLQGIPVSSTAPTNGQVLTFDGPNSRWSPATPPAGGTGTFSGYETKAVEVTAGPSVSVHNVSCPTGKRPLSGGFSLETFTGGDGTFPQVVTTHADRVDPSSWHFKILSASGSSATYTLFVVCASVAP